MATQAPLRSNHESSRLAGTNACVDMTVPHVLQAKAIPRSESPLANTPIEILIMFICELDFVSAICLGLTCYAAYEALKKKHPGPIDLMSLRGHFIHHSSCRIGILNNWSGKSVCLCFRNPSRLRISHTLAHFIILPTTFASFQLAVNSREYRLSRNRGDCRWTFVNKRVYGERGLSDHKTGLEEAMDKRYKVYALFRRFDADVLQGRTVRLPSYLADVRLRNTPSLIPSPSGLSYEDWVKAVGSAMVADMKNWGSSREGWMTFWKEQARYFEESDVFASMNKTLFKQVTSINGLLNQTRTK